MTVDLETLTPEKRDTKYFAFRIETTLHQQMRAILAERGISSQKFFEAVVRDLVHRAIQGDH